METRGCGRALLFRKGWDAVDECTYNIFLYLWGEAGHLRG